MAKTITNPDVAAQRWANNLSAATDFWLQQIEASAWKSYAASDAAEANYRAELEKALAEQRRKKAIEQTSDEVWKAGARAAAATLGTKVRASQTKMQAFLSKLLPDAFNSLLRDQYLNIIF